MILTENLFGDILSDLAAAVGGGLGLAPSASLGSEPPGIFEPVHGSAPDIAGQGEANPIAMILSVAMMFTYGLGRRDIGRAITAAVDEVLAEGIATADQVSGGRAYTTWEVGQAVCGRWPTTPAAAGSSPQTLTVRRSPVDNDQRRMTGAEAVIRCLEAEGVTDVFGLPGGAILPLYDAWAASTTPSATTWCATSRAPATWRRATRAPPARSASHRHLRPGRHQPGHADRRRLPRLHADRCASPARCRPT